MEAEGPHEAAWGRAQTVAVELGERHHVALGQLRRPVTRRRRDPLWRRQRGAAAQQSLLLEL